MNEDQLIEMINDLKLSLEAIKGKLSLMEATMAPQEFITMLEKNFGISKPPKTTKNLLKAIGVIEARPRTNKATKVKNSNRDLFTAAKCTAELLKILEKDLSPMEKDIITHSIKNLIK